MKRTSVDILVSGCLLVAGFAVLSIAFTLFSTLSFYESSVQFGRVLISSELINQLLSL